MKRNYSYLAVPLLIGSLALTGCSSTNSMAATSTAGTAQPTASITSMVDTTEDNIEVTYSKAELTSTWNTSSAAKITCKGTSATITGSGVKAKNGIITISKAGTYVFSGELTDGQIVVNAPSSATVRIVLNNFTITNSDSSAIYGKQSKKIIITLAEDTTNTITDAAEYDYEDETEDEPDAAIFSHDNLIFNGEGTLTVNGSYGTGIRSKDNIRIISGTYQITAVNHGIKGKDYVIVKDGTIDITAGNDGIQSSNDTEEDKGYVVIQGGTITIAAKDDGIHAETRLQIDGGNIQITESNEGLEGLTVQINDGDIRVNSSDDGINAAGGSTDPAADTTADSFNKTTEDSTDTDTSSSASSEADSTNLIHTYQSNATLTSSSSTTTAPEAPDADSQPPSGERPSGGRGGGGMDSTNEDAYISICGGSIYINASADGLDSNGSLYISGGTTLIDGPVSGGDGALDYNGTALISGGTLVAAGSSQMAQSLSESSKQSFLMVYYDTSQPGGTMLNLSDSSGSLLSYTPSKDYQSVCISTPNLTEGSTYTLSSGGSDSETAVNNLILNGTYTAGTKISEITLKGISNQIGTGGGSFRGGSHGTGTRPDGTFGGKMKRGSESSSESSDTTTSSSSTAADTNSSNNTSGSSTILPLDNSSSL